MDPDSLRRQLKFWRWFWKKELPKLFDRWMVFHILVGFSLAFLVPHGLSTKAPSLILPLIGILIGLTFAWAGNAMAILQSEEIRELSEHHEDGLPGYVYSYQSAILILFTCLILWSIIALQVHQALGLRNKYILFFGRVLIFSFSSLTIRECWQVVLSTQWLLITKSFIEKKKRGDKKN